MTFLLLLVVLGLIACLIVGIVLLFDEERQKKGLKLILISVIGMVIILLIGLSLCMSMCK